MKNLFLIWLACLFLLPLALHAQTVVIANESVSTKSLSVKELMDVYTLNKAHWDDGSRITVYDLKGGKTKEAFLSALGMTDDELKRIWLRKQFTGKARPPRALSEEEEVLEAVARTPGAIGYVSERTYKTTRNVRIIARVK